MKRCLMLLLPVILLLAGCGHAPQENESLESMTAPMTADHSQWQQEPYYILQFNVDSVISNAPNVTATASRVIISQGGTYLLSGTLQDAQLTVEIPAGETARLVLCGEVTPLVPSSILQLMDTDVYVTEAIAQPFECWETVGY